ncbi:hypothetical protein [Cryobacterium sp. PH31-O1]|uniref:hypothetical protein n=1 Tax=Cryobacterium sp. PH31-O1 TaxID=3046306 RepID=UPI0024BB996C|nr:hypothetical protein [Cryobacterium sp. PH31-O1]MDJ0338797.1 hypothetical protein [Cryobacterium sp. PH31-O1]
MAEPGQRHGPGLNTSTKTDAKGRAEQVARASYGRLLAVLAAPTGTPLMLQSVLGSDSARIAAAPSPRAFGSRAAARARQTAHPGLPHPVRRSRRDRACRAAATRSRSNLRRLRHRGAYAIDWQATRSREVDPLAGEALYLATTLAALLPQQAGVLGLAALLSFSLAQAGRVGQARSAYARAIGLTADAPRRA